MFNGTVWLRWIKAGDPRKPWLQSARLSVRIHRNRSAFCGRILTNITVSWVATRHLQLNVNICLASDTQANSLLLAVKDYFRNAQWPTIKQTYFLTYLEWCHDESVVLVQVLTCLDYKICASTPIRQTIYFVLELFSTKEEVHMRQWGSIWKQIGYKMLKWITKYTWAAGNEPGQPSWVNCTCGKHCKLSVINEIRFKWNKWNQNDSHN